MMAVLFALLTAMGVLLLPRRRDRRWLARGVARALLRVTGIPLRVIGEWPGSGSCVVVANHASYLDAVVLSAVIPARAAFVAKRELGDVVLIGGFLRRLGTFFVERFNPRAGAEDAEALAHIAGQGQSLVFFAEGGFQRAPGLLPFRLGAFVVASRNRLPVIPIGLRGTRTLLPDGVWWPRRSALEVHIGEPVLASGTGWKDAVCLREATRAAVLNLSNEIDLDGH